MSDPSQISRLDKLRVTREYLAYQLQRTDATIRELEAEEKQERHRAEQARADQGWKIQPQRGEAPPVLHRGGCATYKSRDGYLLDRGQARLALTHETYIVMCEICTPQTDLTDG
ncbi:DUF6233 domain-containing protein [Streptomyces sp. NBC_00842]|uniref:DUF6233 domain-containing protein n=1 Tax=Streptomyces sp. NBC_00842 TaxID=2975848 RepID=UPI002F9078BA|nr:DUF6233 domain-containing protein [Streptomyces sp. NBC_00842]